MGRNEHWNGVYKPKGETDFSWFEKPGGKFTRLGSKMV